MTNKKRVLIPVDCKFCGTRYLKKMSDKGPYYCSKTCDKAYKELLLTKKGINVKDKKIINSLSTITYERVIPNCMYLSVYFSNCKSNPISALKARVGDKVLLTVEIIRRKNNNVGDKNVKKN